ncbi:hypothetical protein [Tsuneonella mangrovi]|uniref:hypothetical protein n=1 Tax=Tsuneonella mangrovi TaxID=1982042 RepID=UPI000BA25847|nr:hypothetical protein [Tsuneonella mangrovi]
MRHAAIATVLGATLLLASCGPGDSDPGPGGVSVGEAKALDQAAEMIEARRLPPGALASPSDQPSDSAPSANPGN